VLIFRGGPTAQRSPSLPGVAYKEPLRKWHVVRGFDTADDCQDFLGSFFEGSQQKQTLNMLEPTYRDYMFAECVAIDEPRLKEKIACPAEGQRRRASCSRIASRRSSSSRSRRCSRTWRHCAALSSRGFTALPGAPQPSTGMACRLGDDSSTERK
jgi:hypothetical protein